MTVQEQLDAAIVDAVRRHRSPLYASSVNDIAKVLAEQQGREPFRVVDQALQRLRKRGAIIFYTRKEAYFNDAIPGWNVVKAAKP